MEQNAHYVNHNRRILNAVAGEQHQQWEKQGNRYKLKKAKKLVAPALGVTFTSLSAMTALIGG